MSEFEAPNRLNHATTVDDVRALVAASTPHFSMHIKGRLQRLVADLPAGDPARQLAEREISRLNQIYKTPQL